VDGFSDTDRQKMTEGSEKHEFQSEVSRLMDIIINSLYTDKQVFLRELISNAADALEKARFHSVQDETFLGDFKDLEVKIEHDPEAKTISILDTAQVLFQTALIESGFEIADPSALVNRVYRLMSKELGVDPEAPLTEIEVPEDAEEEEAAEEAAD